MNELNIHTKENQGRRVIHPFCHLGTEQDGAIYEEGFTQDINLPALLTLDFSTSTTVGHPLLSLQPTVKYFAAEPK